MKAPAWFVIFISFALVISACTPAATPTSAPIEVPPLDQVSTGVAQTLTAQPTQTSTFTPEPSATFTQAPTQPPLPTIEFTIQPSVTSISVPTITPMYPTPLYTLPPVFYPTATQNNGDYLCQIISQSPESWTQFKPRHTFDATWKLKNSGRLGWGSAVTLVYVSGTRMHDYGDSYALGKAVDPGKSITVIVDMTTPKQEGIYETTWGLQIHQSVFCTLNLMIRVYK